MGLPGNSRVVGGLWKRLDKTKGEVASWESAGPREWYQPRNGSPNEEGGGGRRVEWASAVGTGKEHETLDQRERKEEARAEEERVCVEKKRRGKGKTMCCCKSYNYNYYIPADGRCEQEVKWEGRNKNREIPSDFLTISIQLPFFYFSFFFLFTFYLLVICDH